MDRRNAGRILVAVHLVLVFLGLAGGNFGDMVGFIFYMPVVGFFETDFGSPGLLKGVPSLPGTLVGGGLGALLSLGVLRRGWLPIVPLVLFSAGHPAVQFTIGAFVWLMIAGAPGPWAPLAAMLFFALGVGLHAGGLCVAVASRFINAPPGDRA